MSSPVAPVVHSLLPWIIAPLLRALAWTWRIQLNDLAGLSDKSCLPLPPVIWVLWHNRLLIVPVLYERLFRHRKGAALISCSKDGGLLAGCIARFGGEAIRGSSSKGGSGALSKLKRKLAAGYDIYITPDGPRGPRYHMGPGAIWLAQASGAGIMHLSVEYSNCWRLGRWDGFVIPKPFSKVAVTLYGLHAVPATENVDEFEFERERLRAEMMNGTGLH